MRILQWLILGLPWIFVPNVADVFLVPKEAVWALGCWAVILTILFCPHPQLTAWTNPHLKWFLLWVLLWGGFRYWWLLINRPPGSPEITINFQNWIPTLHVLTASVFLWVLATCLLPRKENQLLVSQWLCWSGSLVACYCLGQWLGFDQLFSGRLAQWMFEDRTFESMRFSPYAMTGALGNVNYTATYLAPILPLYLIFRNKRYLVFLIPVIAVLALSRIRFAVLAAIIGLFAYLWIRLWRLHHRWNTFQLILTVVLLIALVWMGWHWKSLWLSDERFYIWKEMVKQLRFNHLTGIGLGNFYMVFNVHWKEWVEKLNLPQHLSGSPWQWAHNDLLQASYETGAIGMVLLGMALWKATTLAWQKASSPIGAAWLASGLAMLAVSATNFPWHFAPCALTGLVILAMWHVPQPRGG